MSNAGMAAQLDQIPSIVSYSLQMPGNGPREQDVAFEEIRLDPEITEEAMGLAMPLGWHEDKDVGDWWFYYREIGPFLAQLCHPKQGEEEFGWRLLIFINFLPLQMNNLCYEIPIAQIRTMLRDGERAKRFTEVLLKRWMNRKFYTEWT